MVYYHPGLLNQAVIFPSSRSGKIIATWPSNASGITLQNPAREEVRKKFRGALYWPGLFRETAGFHEEREDT